MSKLILMTLALSPFILLGVIMHFRTGRDLSTEFLIGAGVLFVIGTGLVGIGCWKRKSHWPLSGVVLIPWHLRILVRPWLWDIAMGQRE